MSEINEPLSSQTDIKSQQKSDNDKLSAWINTICEQNQVLIEEQIKHTQYLKNISRDMKIIGILIVLGIFF